VPSSYVGGVGQEGGWLRGRGIWWAATAANVVGQSPWHWFIFGLDWLEGRIAAGRALQPTQIYTLSMPLSL
jgi:hypothetical protein